MLKDCFQICDSSLNTELIQIVSIMAIRLLHHQSTIQLEIHEYNMQYAQGQGQGQEHDEKQNVKELIHQQRKEKERKMKEQPCSNQAVQPPCYSFDIINRYFPSIQPNTQQSMHVSQPSSSSSSSSFLFTIHPSPQIRLSQLYHKQVKDSKVNQPFHASRYSGLHPSLLMICRFMEDLQVALEQNQMTDSLFQQVYSIVRSDSNDELFPYEWIWFCFYEDYA